MINPVHIAKDTVRLDLVDERYEPTTLNDKRFMKRYVVAVGWGSTLVGSSGIREYLGNPESFRLDPRYSGHVRNRKEELIAQLTTRGDEVLYFIAVYAHRREHVVRFYERNPERIEA